MSNKEEATAMQPDQEPVRQCVPPHRENGRSGRRFIPSVFLWLVEPNACKSVVRIRKIYYFCGVQ